MPSRRILHVMLAVVETSAPYNEHVRRLAPHHHVDICTYFPPKVTIPDSIGCADGGGNLIKFFRTLRRSVRWGQYDLIHTHTPHVAMLVLLMGGLPTVHTVHSSYPHYRWWHRLLLLPIFLFFKRIVCCSRSSYESFPRLYHWLAGNRLTYVPNGVDVERLDAHHASRVEKPFQIIVVGRLIGLKNIPVIFEAFLRSRITDAQLIFVGEGRYRDVVESVQTSLPPTQDVVITGVIPRTDVYQRLHAAHLFISASMVEGLPVSVLEAMASRCPVILSDIPSHREIAVGTNVIPLLKHRDATAFAKEIRRYWKMSQAERDAIGEQCRARVLEAFSLETLGHGYDAVYNEVWLA